MSQRRQQLRGRPKRQARKSNGTRKSRARARILEQRSSKTKCLLDIKKTLKGILEGTCPDSRLLRTWLNSLTAPKLMFESAPIFSLGDDRHAPLQNTDGRPTALVPAGADVAS